MYRGGRETHNKEPDKPIKGRKMSQKDGRDKPKERYVNLFLVFEKNTMIMMTSGGVDEI